MIDEKITQEELVELFGESIPMEAVQVLFDAPDEWTIGMVRAEVRRIAQNVSNPPANHSKP